LRNAQSGIQASFKNGLLTIKNRTFLRPFTATFPPGNIEHRAKAKSSGH